MSQTDQVIDTMRSLGGYSTLGNLYHAVDSSEWKTKTPNESIRRIVQKSNAFFKIQPGLWALNEFKNEILKKFDLVENEPLSEEIFTHSYYQGLVVEIGNMNHFTTYVPAQDKNRKFLEQPLSNICSTIEIPEFSYEKLTNRAKTIDVIWFNDRLMPNSFFEIEHSTDIQNSITKYCDLQDFNSCFIIIAPEKRREQFEKVMSRTAFHEINGRVKFHSYETISEQYNLMCKTRALKNTI